MHNGRGACAARSRGSGSSNSSSARAHQLDLRLRLPPKRLPVADDLEREDLVVLGADLEDLPEGAAPQVAEHFEGVAAERGVGWHGDPIGHGHDQVAELVVRTAAGARGGPQQQASR